MRPLPRLRRLARTALGPGALALALALAPVPALLGPATPAQALDNGLARTPPMGWNDWNAFGCNVTEQLVEQTADVHGLLRHEGRRLPVRQHRRLLDDPHRDSGGNLRARPRQVPRRHQRRRAYVHSKGLKLGIYESAGTATCAGYPGSLDHEQTDANSFASWGVDYLKYDNCNNQGVALPAAVRRHARRARRAPAARSSTACASGASQSVWTWGAQTGNLWRTTGDINASLLLDAVQLPHQRGSFAVRGPRCLERSGHAGGRQRHVLHRGPLASSACGPRWPPR